MLQQPNGPDGKPLNIDLTPLARKKPLQEAPMLAQPVWPFASLFLWPSQKVSRGEATSGRMAQFFSINVRTTDDVLDRDGIRQIAGELSLGATPAGAGLSLSSGEDRWLGGNIRLESCKDGKYYAILTIGFTADHLEVDDAANAKRLAVEIAKRLFELKERPHFPDEFAAAFSKAL